MLNKEDRTRYLRLLKYIRPYQPIIFTLIAALAIYGLTEPVMPVVLKPLLDQGFGEQNLQVVYGMTALLFFGFLLRGIASFTSSYLMTWLAERVVYTLRGEMFRKLLNLPMSYFDRHSQGSTMSRFTYDVLQLMSASTDAVGILIRETVTIFALLITLLIIDWQLTLFILASAPVLTFIIVFVSKKLRHIAHHLQIDMGGLNHLIDEAIRGRAVIRIYDGKEYEIGRFESQNQTFLTGRLAASKISNLASPIVEMTIITALCAVIIIAAQKGQTDPAAMTSGTFAAFLGSVALLFPPIKRLTKITDPIQRGLAAAQSVFSFLDEQEEPQPQLPILDHPKITAGEVVFENVCFAYQEKPILENFNLHIRAGETVALVGQSGSGKSTVAALLAGFYQPQQGVILVDAQATQNMPLPHLRRAIAYVSQETMLFTATVRDNIAYADCQPDEEKMVSAAQSANAAGFITQLPDGYSALVGQGRLSGGQKQRLAIARALYKDAPILILDEATSALDNRSEQKVKEAIDCLREGRTALIIAHRLSTIRNADRIVVLENGNIIEEGTHEELLIQKGYYANLLQNNY